MAQLIKLQDYISRYEQDMFRYPSQFIRMKKDSFHRLREQWESEKEMPILSEPEQEEKQSLFQKIFNRKKEFNVWEEEEHRELPLPVDEHELKQLFLNQVFSFQLKWASSTLQEVSYFDQVYETDNLLKYFLQRFPDTYLLLYQPIFKMKQAVIEGDIIIVTPTDIMCVSVLDGASGTTYQPVDERKWQTIDEGQVHTVVNPLIGLKRMEKMISSILQYHELEFPIKKVVLARNQRILNQTPAYQTEYVDLLNYEEWFDAIRKTGYPIKYQQLKVSEALLEHTQKTFVKRPIWKEEEDHIL
ncbi:NERD domain-containing protein [Tenuibacillus multivorans]|uniref:Nuclease-related domain-containing protein n=1 Tax=Tenuibacillus multivorans TaxID=237069 RepID=A0A1H0ECW7_9BACI|nr:NERD domain-containing protein [Tenuibacillus multivorans]GEL77210.1 hypothetical protein TMU01_14450 [Tenuibacillus multivorans]SDN80191.1 Nuclease-related domain-containing protein [Tenuibacillus multivorans]